MTRGPCSIPRRPGIATPPYVPITPDAAVLDDVGPCPAGPLRPGPRGHTTRRLRSRLPGGLSRREISMVDPDGMIGTTGRSASARIEFLGGNPFPEKSTIAWARFRPLSICDRSPVVLRATGPVGAESAGNWGGTDAGFPRRRRLTGGPISTEGAMAYFAGIETRKDRDLNRAIPGLRDVLLSPNNPTPIGVAFSLGPDAPGRRSGN